MPEYKFDEISKCPRCGDDALEFINEKMGTLFECQNMPDCGQRMDRNDYIKWALQNFGHKIDKTPIFIMCLNGVNKE